MTLFATFEVCHFRGRAFSSYFIFMVHHFQVLQIQCLGSVVWIMKEHTPYNEFCFDVLLFGLQYLT